MKTPDITPAQVAAILTFVVGQAVAFGWLSSSREQLLVSVGSTVIAAAWKLADALIRHGRSGHQSASQVLGEIAALFPAKPTTPAA